MPPAAGPVGGRPSGKEPSEREDGEVDEPPYPVALRLAGRRVVVVGGGPVAQRRGPGLLAAGADVLVVSPRATPAIEGLAQAGKFVEKVTARARATR